MLYARRFAIVAMLVAVPCALSRCELFTPCSGLTSPLSTSKVPYFLDGVWNLDTVDGTDIGTGYVLPLKGGTLLRGNLTFTTSSLDDGSCTAPKHSSGQVVALYQLSGGQTQTEVGSFEFDNPTNVVTLRALGQAADATADLAVNQGLYDVSTMKLVAPIPVPVLGTVNYTLMFGRSPFQ
jgi:hypothetical protein